MEKTIAVIRGDGIGPEIVNEAIKVLNKIAAKYGHTFRYVEVDMGGAAIDKWGEPLPAAMLERCLAADSVLLGAVGAPSGTVCPAISGRKRAFSPCGRVWACMPTTAPQSFGPNWPPPAP